MANTDINMTVSFVEDPTNHVIHVWLSIGTFDLGVICEQPPTEGTTFNSLDATEIQDEWFDRLCPICFKPED